VTSASAWPQYGFDSHKGYSTPEHKRALDDHGPCPIHRRLFAPVRAALDARGLPAPITAPVAQAAELAALA